MGAGLPVLSTLQTLRATGDRVERIEGVLSGTLSYLFNTFAPGQRFSALVADARRQGYTEPDPRDDLSGVKPSVIRHYRVVCRPCSICSVTVTRPWHMGERILSSSARASFCFHTKTDAPSTYRS